MTILVYWFFMHDKEDFMQLKQWLFENRKTISEFAILTGFSRTSVTSILSKKIKPSERFLYEIDKATNGQVKKEDLI